MEYIKTVLNGIGQRLADVSKRAKRGNWKQNDSSAWDYIENRPGGYDVAETKKVELLFDLPTGFKSGDAYFSPTQSGLETWMAYESDAILSTEELSSAIVSSNNGITQDLKLFNPTDGFYYLNTEEVSPGTYGVFPPHVAVATKPVEIWGCTFAKPGLYVVNVKYNGNFVDYITSITYEHLENTPVKIPEKYLDVESLKTLYVNITQTEDSDGNVTYHADKRVTEILSAIEENKYIYGVYVIGGNKFILQVESYTENDVIFAYSAVADGGTVVPIARFISIRFFMFTNSGTDTVEGVVRPDFLDAPCVTTYISEDSSGNLTADIPIAALYAMSNNRVVLFADYAQYKGSYDKYQLTTVNHYGTDQYSLTFISPSAQNKTLYASNTSGSDVWSFKNSPSFAYYTLTGSAGNYVLKDQWGVELLPAAVPTTFCCIYYNYHFYYPYADLTSISPEFRSYHDVGRNGLRFSDITLERRSNTITVSDWQDIPISGVVSYSSAQSLTDTQKEQARVNIGAAAVSYNADTSALVITTKATAST